MNSTIGYSLILLFAGLGIPFAAALNGSLGVKLQNPIAAVAILFLVGSVVSITVLLLTQDLPTMTTIKHSPKSLMFGGVFIFFYIVSITLLAPRFGVANSISFVLLGQLISMSMIDHFGLVGAAQQALTLQRFLGLVLMMVGICMVLAQNVADKLQ